MFEAFEAERASRVPYACRFDGFRAVMAAVSKTCLVNSYNNKDSVAAKAVGSPPKFTFWPISQMAAVGPKPVMMP